MELTDEEYIEKYISGPLQRLEDAVKPFNDTAPTRIRKDTNLPEDGTPVWNPINYKFNEDQLIEEFKQYIDKTYDGHYSHNKFQATEFIFDNGHGIGFTVGNIMKYAQRYGHKGGPDDQRKDIIKILHYALMLLYLHDTNNKE